MVISLILGCTLWHVGKTVEASEESEKWGNVSEGKGEEANSKSKGGSGGG
jgi:hypothetical protein